MEKVLVIDLGSQTTQLIARRIRELRVYSEIVSNSISAEVVKRGNPVGIILSGGPASVYEFGSPEVDREIFKLGIPILGICYGMQLTGKVFGVPIHCNLLKEFGKTELYVDAPDSPLYAGLNVRLVCWMSHGDSVSKLPRGFRLTAHTSNSPLASFENRELKIYGVLYHPEVTHTPWGKDLLKNFLKLVCEAKFTWKMSSFIEKTSKELREQVGKKNVICALSGGIDSICTAALVHRAVGDQLKCIFVDHGLLREGEASQVKRTFQSHFKSRLLLVNAKERFQKRLSGVYDPEDKRKIIGEEFIRIFEERASQLDGKVDYLAQGTLYPDVIESKGVGLHASKIKTHHNVGGLPSKMKLKLIEPLRELFKDEVRLLAKELGLPDEIIWRQPFPGPGLAIRITGTITDEKLRLLRRADRIVQEEIRKEGLYEKVWQAFCVLVDAKSVGVMGDKRTYGYPISVRVVNSQDAMTADWARLPYEMLERISNRIINEVPGITRVLYDISSKPPATIEWE